MTVETESQREVLNYVRALERGIARLSELPLSKRLIREMHAGLMRGVRGQERTPGDFRRSQNWIGGTNPSDDDAPIPVLLRCALLHFQFETIHPFLDGNGRLGRLLIVFYLVERGVLTQPLLYLSAFFERNRDAYVGALQGVRERGDVDTWFQLFLEGVTQQARRAIDSADALLQLREDFRSRLRAARARGQAADAAEGLIGNPFVSAPRLAQDLGVTRQGAQYVIASLERAGLIEAFDLQTRPALYVARDVLEVLQRD